MKTDTNLRDFADISDRKEGLVRLFRNFNLDMIVYPLTFAVQNFLTMANHKATKKDMRQAAKRRDRNRYFGKTTRNAIRDLKVITDKKGAKEAIPSVEGMIDKLAKRGIIHKNKAANLKSKLAKKVNALA